MKFLADNWFWLTIVFAILAGAVAALWSDSSKGSGSSLPGTEGKRRSPLELMSARQLRHIGAAYGYRISGKVGNTWGRVLFFIVGLVLPVSTLTYAVVFVFDTIARLSGHYIPWWYQGVLVATLAAPAVFWAAQRVNWIIAVPQLTGAKAVQLFTRRVHVYLQGLNITFGPLETLDPKTDDLTIRSSIVSRPATFRTSDKVRVTFEHPMLRMRVFPPLLLVNASHDIKSIEQAATNIVQNAMNDEILDTPLENVQQAETLSKLEDTLILALEGVTESGESDPRHRDTKGLPFEAQYGVIAETVPFGVPTPSEEYNKATEGKVAMTQILETAKDIEKSGTTEGSKVTHGEAVNIAMANVGKTNRETFEFELGERASSNLNTTAAGIASFVERLAQALRGGAQPQSPGGQ
ncbi:MAG: hypothetical protein KGI70_00280 [Patescibacteria group bacterium]|nr:hypothetical protein [Patescibacteria group bacterium]